ncbi:hypothetical protein CHU32_24085 [Superficieibacter electus]|uniref:Uncharacterized protein n=1 Tax=Superficieibacter electus TaxID=2022662 RepID=A0A2P5GIH4_9ENTR|nr:hypothetical protein [Superficieibacter electus]POP41048.1 hypothetical protein CHU33_24535 [Superficieibacter electus]POP42942.1 hypothetical protein CHU32_24085 [Superficieibacter electus]
MIIIFGWLKERYIHCVLLSAWCFQCSRIKSWALAYEKEWVTFFGIKTIPFICKRFLVCEGCGDVIPLTWREWRTWFASGDVAAGQHFIEQYQLARKTEVQRRFLLVRREEFYRNDEPPEK